MDAGLRRNFLDGRPNDEAKAVKAFVSRNAENALKTKPKVRDLSCIRLILTFVTLC